MITTFHDLRREELALAEKRICKKIAKLLNVNKLVIEGFNAKNYHIEINDISIDLSIDQYNNIALADNTPIIEIPLLKALHILCNHYLEHLDSYHYRSGTGLFIDYIRTFRDQLKESDIVEMCRIDDQDNEYGCFSGLIKWLLGEENLRPILGEIHANSGTGYYDMSPSLIALLLDYVKTNRNQYKNRIEYTTIQNGELQ